MSDYRIEKDTLGDVKVPSDVLWGAQTERSRNNFRIGPVGSMPIEIVHAFAHLKRAAAITNCECGVLSEETRDLIFSACAEILNGDHDDQFPLVIWQTGSGTQSNMNVNEVVANRCIEPVANNQSPRRINSRVDSTSVSPFSMLVAIAFWGKNLETKLFYGELSVEQFPI